MCADECQNAFLPSLSFHVYRINDPSVVSGGVVSITVSLNLAEITFLAKLSLMLLATSMTVVFFSNDLWLPSVNVIRIIICMYIQHNRAMIIVLRFTLYDRLSILQY